MLWRFTHTCGEEDTTVSAALLHIDVENQSNRDLACYPVTYGVPLGQGVLADGRTVAIELPGGERRAVQARTLERWPDGSAKWLLLDFDLPLAANEKARVALVEADVAPADPIIVEEGDEQIVVRTARLTADRYGRVW